MSEGGTKEEECFDDGFRSSPMRFWFGDFDKNQSSSATKKRAEAKRTQTPVCTYDLKCPRCGIDNQRSGAKMIKKNGFDKNHCQLYFCNSCRRGFSCSTSVSQTPCKSDKEIKRETAQVKKEEEDLSSQLQAMSIASVKKSTKKAIPLRVTVSAHDLMCPRCGIGNQKGGKKMIRKNGFDKYRRQLFFCKNCRRGFSSATAIKQTPCKNNKSIEFRASPKKEHEEHSESIISKFRQLSGMPRVISSSNLYAMYEYFSHHFIYRAVADSPVLQTKMTPDYSRKKSKNKTVRKILTVC